jgi:predicted dehydrogenase
MDPINVGMLGAGFIGMFHSYAMRNLEIVKVRPSLMPRLLILADINEERRGLCRQRFGWQMICGEWQQIVTNSNIDLFINAAPNDLHLEPSVLAARNKKHIFCEKPLAANADQAYRLWCDVAQTGVIHQCAFIHRFIPALRLAREIIQSGTLGEILQFRSAYLMSTALEPGQPMSWRFQRSVAGSGAIGDLGSHHIDQARYLVGEIEEVAALGTTAVKEREGKRVDVDDAFVAIAKFDNGVIGTIEGSRIACGYSHTGRIEIDGSKGSIKFDAERLNELQIADGVASGFRTIQATHAGHPLSDFWWDAGIQGSHPIGWIECFVHQAHHLLNAIAGRTSVGPLAATFEDGYKVAEVCEALGRSWRSGTREKIKYRTLPTV